MNKIRNKIASNYRHYWEANNRKCGLFSSVSTPWASETNQLNINSKQNSVKSNKTKYFAGVFAYLEYNMLNVCSRL